jgi:hypothetical protein
MPIPAENKATTAEFLHSFGLTDMSSIKFFGDKVMKKNQNMEDFLRCFMTVALATFYCQTSSTKPSKWGLHFSLRKVQLAPVFVYASCIFLRGKCNSQMGWHFSLRKVQIAPSFAYSSSYFSSRKVQLTLKGATSTGFCRY